MTKNTSLSLRGSVLKGKSMRGLFGSILADPYDSERNPNGFINIGTAENYTMLEDVTDFTNSNLDLTKLDFTYDTGPWGTTRLAKAMARHMTKYFDALEPIDPKDVLITNGVTPLCNMLGFVLGDPGDGILFTTPIYQAFEPDFGLVAQVKSVLTDFGAVDPVSVEGVVKYEEALQKAMADGVRIRALMLCNPHNPLGVCYPKETIIELMKLCQKYQIHLLADEIYATSVYDVPDSQAVPFTSVLSFDTSPYIDSSLLHVIYGMSKDMAAGGLRVGAFHTRSKEVMEAVGAISQFHWASLPSQEIAATMLEDEEWVESFIAKSNKQLAARNKLARSILESKNVKFHAGSNAGFFLWLDLRPWLVPNAPHVEPTWEDEAALSKKMIENKIFLTTGQSMHAAAPGFFRLVFSQQEATLREGLRRLFVVLGI